MKRKSNELLVCTEAGVVCVRSVRRLPIERRWSEDCISWVKWAPWHMYRGCEDADGELPEGVPAEERSMPGSSGDRVVFIETREKAPRDFFISKRDADKYGYTRGWAGVPVGLEV